MQYLKIIQESTKIKQCPTIMLEFEQKKEDRAEVQKPKKSKKKKGKSKSPVDEIDRAMAELGIKQQTTVAQPETVSTKKETSRQKRLRLQKDAQQKKNKKSSHIFKQEDL